MRGGPYNLDLDTFSLYATSGCQIHYSGLDYPPRLSAQALAEKSRVLLVLGHLVHYRLQAQQRLSLSEYMDFLRRARWKLYRQARRPMDTGRYLDVIDWP